jgi:DNA-binding response OmpR family regulator
MRIMLVDDDARMRQALSRLLETAGFDSVRHAADGQDALDQLSSGVAQVDLIITDCIMPRLDGISLVTALRARGDRTPVIMISGEHDPHLIVRAVKAGVNNYIPKPIHAQTLFEKISQTMGIARAVAL